MDRGSPPPAERLLEGHQREILRHQVDLVLDSRIRISTEYVRLWDLYHPRIIDASRRLSGCVQNSGNEHDSGESYARNHEEIFGLEDSRQGEFLRFKAKESSRIGLKETPDDLRLWVENRLASFEERRKDLAHTGAGRTTIASPDISSALREANGAMALLLVGFGLTHAPSPKQQGHRYDRL